MNTPETPPPSHAIAGRRSPETHLPLPATTTPVAKMAYTVDEAVAAIGVSRRQLYYLMKSGDLPYSQRGGRRLIRAEALQALLN